MHAQHMQLVESLGLYYYLNISVYKYRMLRSTDLNIREVLQGNIRSPVILHKNIFRHLGRWRQDALCKQHCSGIGIIDWYAIGSGAIYSVNYNNIFYLDWSVAIGKKITFSIQRGFITVMSKGSRVVSRIVFAEI